MSHWLSRRCGRDTVRSTVREQSCTKICRYCFKSFLHTGRKCQHKFLFWLKQYKFRLLKNCWGKELLSFYQNVLTPESTHFLVLTAQTTVYSKEALSVLMPCAPVFIFTSGSPALLGRPHCSLAIWLLLLAIFNTLFWVYVNLFHEKTDKTGKYSKSVIFVWYKMATDGY